MRRATFSRREIGASAIEFAIVFPLFFGLIFIMVSYGLLFSLQHSITEAGPLLTVGQKNSVLTAVTNKLSPVLTVLDGPLTNLFNALGITLGGADITIVWVGTNQSRDPLGVPSLAR